MVTREMVVVWRYGEAIRFSRKLQQKGPRRIAARLDMSMRAKEIRVITGFLNMSNGVERGVIFKEEKRADLV